MGYSHQRIQELLEKINIVGSRYDEEETDGYTICRMLAKDKNAFATSRVFDYISGCEGKKEIIIMNSCRGDAKTWSENVCWMYDCDFELLDKDDIENIVVCGPRGKDYRLRLLLAGIPDDKISYTEDELDSPEKLKLTGGSHIYVPVSYTHLDVYKRQGHYGGWADDILGGWMKPDEEGRPCVSFEDRGLSAEEDPYQTHGRAPHCEDGIFMIPYNDFEALEETFEKWHDEIAGVHFEGINWDHDGLYPKPGYLERMRELCDKYNVVMSMDEIITGFRLGLGGAQACLLYTS